MACADVDGGRGDRHRRRWCRPRAATAHVLVGDVTDADACAGIVGGGGRSDGRARRAGAQRRHRRWAWGCSRHDAGAVGRRCSRSTSGRTSCSPRRRCRVMPEGGGDRVHLVDRRAHAGKPHPRLRRVEGGHHRAVPPGRGRGGPRGACGPTSSRPASSTRRWGGWPPAAGRRGPRRRCPSGRQGTAWEVAAPVVFLLSDDASYITSQLLAVDGGLTGCRG